jgi:hypothetical protein
MYKSWSCSFFSFLHSPIISLLLGSNILNTMFSYTLNLCSSLNLKDQVSYPYKTAGKIIVFMYFNPKFLDSRWGDTQFWT